MIELLYATGVRVSEMVSLKLGDINEDLSQIIINTKGNKERVIPIISSVKRQLNNYLNELKTNFKKKKDQFLFFLLIQNKVILQEIDFFNFYKTLR